MKEKKFNFQEALSYIKSGLQVKLTLNGVLRIYTLGQGNDILCIPKGNLYQKYTVKNFKMDAIMSDDWELYEPENK